MDPGVVLTPPPAHRLETIPRSRYLCYKERNQLFSPSFRNDSTTSENRISNLVSGVSSDSSHHPREVHLVRFILYVAYERIND